MSISTKAFPTLGGWHPSYKELFLEFTGSDGKKYRTGLRPKEYPFYAGVPIVNGVPDFSQARFYVDKDGNLLVQNKAGSKIDFKENQFFVKVDFSNLKLFEAVVDIEGHGDYTDIQSALNAGKKSIYVRKGTYEINSPITILSSGVTITGESWTNTIIKVANGKNCHAIQIGNGSTTLSDIVITDIQIDGNKANQTIGRYGIYIYGGTSNLITNLIIQNCRIINCSSHGIRVNSSENIWIVRNQIMNNKENGIYFAGSNYNIISENRIESNEKEGIYILSSNHNEFYGNQINSNGSSGIYDGIYLNGGHYSIINGNQIKSNSGNGIYLYSTNFCNIAGNQFKSQGTNGIRLDSSLNNQIIGNQIEGSNGSGILLSNSSNNTLTGNRISGSVIGYGVRFLNSNDNILTGNQIRGNHTFGIWLDGANTNILAENQVYGNSSHGIYLESSDSNLIIGNRCSANNGYGVNISNAYCDNNLVVKNYLTGNVSGSLNDAGTGTIKAASTTNDNVV